MRCGVGWGWGHGDGEGAKLLEGSGQEAEGAMGDGVELSGGGEGSEAAVGNVVMRREGCEEEGVDRGEGWADMVEEERCEGGP